MDERATDAQGGIQMAKRKFGTLGDEAQVLEVIRRMNSDGKTPTVIAKALTDLGHTTRAGHAFSRQGVLSLVVDLDRARRVVLDLRQRSTRLSESLIEVEALAATDASCAKINARVQTLQDGGLPQVEAIQEAVGVA